MLFKRKFRQKSMTSLVVYEGDLRTINTHMQSSSQLETDAPTDNNGKGERFSPTDLLATSLANCMLTTMGIRTRNMDIDLKGIKVEVEKIMKSDPRRVVGINLVFHIPENLGQSSEKDKEFLKQVAENCPVAKSLHPDIEVNINWGAWS
jgi:putative redox protein